MTCSTSRSPWAGCRPGPARAPAGPRWAGSWPARPSSCSCWWTRRHPSRADGAIVRAHRHLERQLAHRPASPGRGVDRLRPTRRPLPAGDQAGRRRLPPRGLRRPRLRDRPSRGRAVERGGHRQPGGAVRGLDRSGVDRRRPGHPAHRRRLRRGAGGLGLRPQRAEPRQRALSRPSWRGWPGCGPCWRRRAHPTVRWPSAATSTWPPRTATSGTRPSSRA